MTEYGKAELDKRLTIGEMSDAVQSMRRGKTPGPDGIPIEIYKLFPDKLLPPLLEMFEEAYETGNLPPLLHSALISLVPKLGKPQQTGGPIVLCP